MSELRYSVILKRQDQLKTPEIAMVLAGVRKVPVQDMLQQARACWGIIEEDQSEAEARALAQGLEAAGLSALALPSALLQEIPPATSLAAADWNAVVWKRVAVISAVALKKTESKTVMVKEGPGMAQKVAGLGLMMVTGLPIKIGPKTQTVAKTVESSELFCYLDLVLTGPETRLRVDAQDFDYSVLCEKKVYDSFGNFKLLMGQALEKAPAALRGRGTGVLLAGRPAREMGYESLKDVERESRWLLTLRELKL